MKHALVLAIMLRVWFNLTPGLKDPDADAFKGVGVLVGTVQPCGLVLRMDSGSVQVIPCDKVTRTKWVDVRKNGYQ